MNPHVGDLLESVLDQTTHFLCLMPTMDSLKLTLPQVSFSFSAQQILRNSKIGLALINIVLSFHEPPILPTLVSY